jgi:hypothetical protein
MHSLLTRRRKRSIGTNLKSKFIYLDVNLIKKVYNNIKKLTSKPQSKEEKRI